MSARTCPYGLGVGLAIAASLNPTSNVLAAEGGTSFYLLGSRGPMAGFTPPPGVYVQNDLYRYDGAAQKTISFDLGGRLIADVDASALINLTTLLWVTPLDVAGGNLALSTTVPIGGPDVTGSLERSGRAVTDKVTTLGDPVMGAFVGWHEGDFHWQVGASVNVPIGNYQQGEIANLSFNHWAADLYTSGTWLDPGTGFELSGALGITFNSEDKATHYRNGTEVHFEGAAIQHFSEAFDLGLVGYYYDQVSPDEGSGVPRVLGGFEGRAAAIGATIGYVFQAGEVPVATRVKYYHEFDVTNRLKGDSVFLTVSMPLAVAGH